VLAFLISALVVYYVLVVPVARLLQLFERNQAASSRDCPECTMSIPVPAALSGVHRRHHPGH
jgi:large conductance mechanosensitive channel